MRSRDSWKVVQTVARDSKGEKGKMLKGMPNYKSGQ